MSFSIASVFIFFGSLFLIVVVIYCVLLHPDGQCFRKRNTEVTDSSAQTEPPKWAVVVQPSNDLLLGLT